MTSVSRGDNFFQITADDGEVAGHAYFRDRDNERLFFHTEIDDAYGGQGLGGTLVRAALAQTAAEGTTVVAICPFVKGWLEKHPDELELDWRPPSTEDHDWIKEQL